MKKTAKKTIGISVLTIWCCIVAFVAVGCNKEETKDTVTQNFYVSKVDKDEQCGYLLFEDRGSPGLYHNFFVWTKDLPKEYREFQLPVTVTFSKTGEKCGNYPTINIIKIQKQ